MCQQYSWSVNKGLQGVEGRRREQRGRRGEVEGVRNKLLSGSAREREIDSQAGSASFKQSDKHRNRA